MSATNETVHTISYSKPVIPANMERFARHDAARDLAGCLLVSGAGCAIFNVQITAAAVSAVPPEKAATASAICVTMRQIGFAFGIALIGALLQRNDPHAYATAFAARSVTRPSRSPCSAEQSQSRVNL